MKKIEIEIDDKKIFTELAYMLDRDAVVENIADLRKRWHLDKELISVNNFLTWLKEPHYDFRVTADVYDRIQEIEEQYHFGEIYFHPDQDKQKNKEISEIDPMQLELEFLCKKNCIKIRFKDILLKAIVCGTVVMSDWEKAIGNDKDFIHREWVFNLPKFEQGYKVSRKDEIKRDREWHWEK